MDAKNENKKHLKVMRSSTGKWSRGRRKTTKITIIYLASQHEYIVNNMWLMVCISAVFIPWSDRPSLKRYWVTGITDNNFSRDNIFQRSCTGTRYHDNVKLSIDHTYSRVDHYYFLLQHSVSSVFFAFVSPAPRSIHEWVSIKSFSCYYWQLIYLQLLSVFASPKSCIIRGP